jgi:hypothetical protein
MHKFLITFLFYLISLTAQTQQIPDSVLTKYKNSKTTLEKNAVIHQYLSTTNNDSLINKRVLEITSYFIKNKDEVGLDIMKFRAAFWFCYFGRDYPTALNRYYEVLNNFINRKDTNTIIEIYYGIESAYNFSNNYLESIAAIQKVLPYITQDTGRYSFGYVYNILASSCAQALLPDSGIIYAQKSIAIFEKYKDTFWLGVSSSTLAGNYIAKGEYDIALPFLRKAYSSFQKTIFNDYDRSFLNNDFAQLFLGKKQYDSTVYYAHLSLASSTKISYKQQELRSYECLYKTFDQLGKADSANKYYRLAIALKDSNFSADKQKAIESAKFNGQLQQQEQQQKELQKQQERKQNIQYALIAIGIIVLLSLFLLLSRSFITNVKWIEFFGVVALLIVFEFLNLLLHPFLENITHHNLFLMLLGLVCIAAILVPIHHKIEKWAVSKLVEKNKAIRLAKAKKTIEELEKG